MQRQLCHVGFWVERSWGHGKKLGAEPEGMAQRAKVAWWQQRGDKVFRFWPNLRLKQTFAADRIHTGDRILNGSCVYPKAALPIPEEERLEGPGV